MTPRFIARQYSHPRGLLGRLVVRLMNRHNANINFFAAQQLAVAPADRVLEIGFGGGKLLEQFIANAAFVGGVDRSPYAIRRARMCFERAIRAGRADFREGNVEAIPFATASFTKVITVHTVYFWKSLPAGFQEIHRVLQPGGRAVVGFLPKERMDLMHLPGDIFRPRTPEEVTDAVEAAGFGEVRVDRRRPTTPWNVIVATR